MERCLSTFENVLPKIITIALIVAGVEICFIIGALRAETLTALIQ